MNAHAGFALLDPLATGLRDVCVAASAGLEVLARTATSKTWNYDM